VTNDDDWWKIKQTGHGYALSGFFWTPPVEEFPFDHHQVPRVDGPTGFSAECPDQTRQCCFFVEPYCGSVWLAAAASHVAG